MRLGDKSHVRSKWGMAFCYFWGGLHSITHNPRGLNCSPRVLGKGDFCYFAPLAVQTLYFVSVVHSLSVMFAGGCWFPSLSCQLLFISGCSATSTVHGMSISVSQWLMEGIVGLNILQAPLFPSSEVIFTMQNPGQDSLCQRLNLWFSLFSRNRCQRFTQVVFM